MFDSKQTTLTATNRDASSEKRSKVVKDDLNGRKKSLHMSGRIFDILCQSCFLIIPMLAVSAALLTMTFKYRVQHNTNTASTLRMPDEQDEPGVYYVKLDSTYLIFVSSWSSTIATMLFASIMTLVSYPIARQLLNATRSDQPWRLPSPYQLALTVDMLNGGGGQGSLWRLTKYLFGWDGLRRPQAKALTSSTIAVVAALLLAYAT